MSELLATAGPIGVFVIMFGTAVFPWLNAELAVVALPSLAGDSRTRLAGLFAVAVAGHMSGKSLLYWMSRRGGRSLPAKVESVLEKLSGRLTRHRSSAAGLVFFSSLTGLPPFYLVTLASGAVRMNFALYLGMGTAGRALHLAIAMFFGDPILRYFLAWYNGA